MKTSVRRFLAASAVLAPALIGATQANAEPVVYTGSAMTSGQIGNTPFQNALVTFTFRGDTANAVPFSFPNGTLTKGTPCDAPPHGAHAACGYINDVGTTTVTIQVGHEKIEATLDAANQVFVSYDVQNGGIGFGRYYQGTLLPTYPLSFRGGTIKALADIQYNQATTYSAALSQLTTTLATPTWVTGDALFCDNPLGVNCTTPAAGGPLMLTTDRGTLYVTASFTNASQAELGEGFFSVELPQRRHHHHHGGNDGWIVIE
ncbi:MAG TPA: hypothetical protein VMU33_19240 [Burkholderiaceae bacterium]|nr:hypothetical protein [Burkholderiaceae bacterium]